MRRQPCSILRDCPLCACGAQTVTAGGSSQEKDKTSDGDTNGAAGEPEKSHSNSSTLSDRRPSDSSLCSIEEEHRYVYDMVQAILLSTRDNVNFVNEVFHQVHLSFFPNLVLLLSAGITAEWMVAGRSRVLCCPLLAVCYYNRKVCPAAGVEILLTVNVLPLKAFLLPSCEASATRKVIKVYRKWILQDKPGFMTEPDTTTRSDEVDDGSEQTLSTEISSHSQVKPPDRFGQSLKNGSPSLTILA